MSLKDTQILNNKSSLCRFHNTSLFNASLFNLILLRQYRLCPTVEIQILGQNKVP